MEVKTGDKVKISTVKEAIEGRLLESSDSSLYLIKLDSGYNIGVKRDDVTNIEKIREKKKNQEKQMKIKSKKNLPKIDMIITGGTISSRLDPETGGVSWLTSPEDLIKFYPEMFDIVNVGKIKKPFMKASENMDYKDWQIIAREVVNSLNDKDVEGVIVTHGTDFLHYTGSALSFFLKNLNKPVVLTYSQRSSDRASSDAKLNLLCSAKAAVSDIAEVMLVGHANENDDFCYALLGSKVRKLHSSRRDAFKPVNIRPLAKIWPDKIEKIVGGKERNKKKVKLDDKFNDNIALIKFYPGMDPEIFNFLEKYDGVVLELSGLGHLAIDEARKNLLPSLKRLIDAGVIVCGVAQTIFGGLDPLVYSPGRKLIKTGLIFLEDMLAETAYVKLGYVLGKTKNYNEVKKLMLTNIAGEINDRLEV